MNEGINLLAKSNKPKVQEPANVRIVRIIGLSILFLIGSSAIVLFILISFSPLPGLQKQEQSLVTELSQYRPRVASLTVVEQRASAIDKFLTSRKDYPGIISLINGILPADVHIEAFKAENKKLFTFAVVSNSLASLDSVIKNLDEINKQKSTFVKAKMVSLGLTDDLTQFILTIQFDLT